MTENITGTVVTATVTGTRAGIFAGTPPTRDALLVTNNTLGSIVFLNDVDADSRQFPVRAGETREIPFRSGQVYAFATATTEEELEEADIEVRAITVDSALARDVSTTLAGFAQYVATSIRSTCGEDDLVLEVEAIRKTDLTGVNARYAGIAPIDIDGRSLVVRSAAGTAVYDWITATKIDGEPVVKVEFEDIPRGATSFAVVAILDSDPTDVLGLFRGSVRGI